LTRRNLLIGVVATAAITACSKTDVTASAPPATTARPTAGSGAPSSSTATSTSTSTTSTSTTSTTATTALPGTVAPATTSSTVPAGGCVLTPELTAGPYYLDDPLVRRDITEGRPGTPLDLSIAVVSTDCTPLAGVAVDIWHCDAGGEYSGFNGNSLGATQAGGTNDKRFLRGVQVTDADGVARFTTIVPGWYEGRAVHIHLSVHAGAQAATTIDGGHVAHTGQLFFDDALLTTILAGDAYAGHTGNRTTNAQDSIFRGAGPGAVTALEGSIATGYRGRATCTIDPSATPPAAPLF